MQLLLRIDWFVLLLECSWQPRRAGKRQSSGLARRYGIGNGLRHNFVNDSMYQDEKRDTA